MHKPFSCLAQLKKFKLTRYLLIVQFLIHGFEILFCEVDKYCLVTILIETHNIKKNCAFGIKEFVLYSMKPLY
jgi:hypothetical protein